MPRDYITSLEESSTCLLSHRSDTSNVSYANLPHFINILAQVVPPTLKYLVQHKLIGACYGHLLHGRDIKISYLGWFLCPTSIDPTVSYK